MERKSWYRKVVAGTAAGLLLAVAACSDSDESGDGAAVDWWHIQTGEPLGPVWTELIGEFEELHEDEGWEIDETPIENEDFKSVLTTAMQGGDPPDLFQSWGGGVLRQQVEAGLIRDVTDELSDVIATLSPGALEPYTIDGRVYGIPFDMGMTGIWYNKALFEEAGLDPDNPPTTWDDFLDTVTALQDADITPVALAGSENWTGHFWAGNLMTRVAGVDAFVEAFEQRSFDNPDFVRALELMEDFVAMNPFQPAFQEAGYGDPEGQAALVGSGEAAMELMGQWAPSVQADASGTDGLGEDLGWFPFPEVQGGQGSITEVFGGGNGFSFGVNAPDATIEFMRFLMSDEIYSRLLVEEPGWVTVRDGATAPDDDPNRGMLLESVQTATGFQLYLDQDLPPAVGDQVNESVGALIAGTATPEEALERITNVFQAEPDL